MTMTDAEISHVGRSEADQAAVASVQYGGLGMALTRASAAQPTMDVYNPDHTNVKRAVRLPMVRVVSMIGAVWATQLGPATASCCIAAHNGPGSVKHRSAAVPPGVASPCPSSSGGGAKRSGSPRIRRPTSMECYQVAAKPESRELTHAEEWES